MFSQPFSQSWFACWTYVAFIAVVKINNSQEVYTWAFLGSTLRELICPNLVCMYVCMCVCVYVRHAQKIAKLFFSVRSTQFSFKLNILFQKKYSNLLGPKTLRLVVFS